MKKSEFPELEAMKKLLDEKKTENVVVLDVRERSPFSSYWILATVSNFRALGAIADDVEEEFAKLGLDVKRDGIAESGWVVIEGGEVVVHLFMEVNRKEIDFEGMIEWEKEKRKKASSRAEAKKEAEAEE